MKKLILLLTVLISFNSMAAADVSKLTPLLTAQYNGYCAQAAIMSGKGSNYSEYHRINALKFIDIYAYIDLKEKIKIYIFDESKSLDSADVTDRAVTYYANNCPNLLK